MINRAVISEGSSVLDIGTGTGEVALRASRLVGQNGLVVAVDSEEEMLRIARRKARRLGAGNTRFRLMSFEKLDLPEDKFDTILGNYSICCCLDYESTLSECLRVLKPGGRLLYNHSGLGDPLEFQLALKIFERYQTKNPSTRLAALREADMIQAEAVEKYRDPSLTLGLMRSLGYRDAEAAITQRAIRYMNAGAYLDRMLGFNWRNEADEIPEADVLKFRAEAAEALGSLSQGPEFWVKDEMVFFSGSKV